MNRPAPEAFVTMLEVRADALDLDAAKQQRLTRAQEVSDLLTLRRGTVRGVVTGWVDDISPVVESVFDVSLPEDPILELGKYALYQPTVFEGVRGRLLANTIDEIMGPGFSLDMSAEPPEAVEEGPDVWPVTQRLFFNMYVMPRLNR